MRKPQKRYNRPVGTVETFAEVGSLFQGSIADMVAEVNSGAATLVDQAFSGSTLNYQVSFNELGSSTVKITTTFQGTAESFLSIIQFNATDDGSEFIDTGYV